MLFEDLREDEIADELFIIQTRYPKVIYSHNTALSLLGYASRPPLNYSLTIPSGTSSSNLAKSNLKIYKVKSDLFELGLQTKKTYLGNLVRTYNIGRTLVDLIRSRNKLDIQDFQHAIKMYLEQPNKNIPLLIKYAKLFRVQNILLKYLEVLL